MLLLHVGEGVAQHQPALGVGVEDLHGLAGQGFDDVPGAGGFAVGHVFRRRHHGHQVDRQPQLADRLHRPEYAGGAAHVVLHLVHAGAGLQGDTAGIEGNALADQGHRLAGGALVVHHDQAALAAAALGHGAKRAHAHLFRLGVADHLHGQLFLVILAELAGAPGQVLRVAIVGRHVAQILGQRGPGGHRLAHAAGLLQAVITLGRPEGPLLQRRRLGGFAAVQVEPVGGFFRHPGAFTHLPFGIPGHGHRAQHPHRLLHRAALQRAADLADQFQEGVAVQLALVPAADQKQAAGGQARRLMQPRGLALVAGEISGLNERLDRFACLIGQVVWQGCVAAQGKNHAIRFDFC